MGDMHFMVLIALPEWFCLMLLGAGMLLTCPFLTEVCFGVYEWWGGTGEVGDGGVGGGDGVDFVETVDKPPRYCMME